ncbi:exopolyphosphatase [Escherichia coli]|uniref:Exopolyphosphatase n=1 Tax=Escherichia coli TaxID=562 RepID=A0A377CZP9_ECOLX|nr:exopolyphosphatase [Escherichia coli]
MMATLVRYHRKAIKLDDLPRFTLFKKKQFLPLIQLLRLGVLLNNQRQATTTPPTLTLITDDSHWTLRFPHDWFSQNALVLLDLEKEQEYWEGVAGWRLKIEEKVPRNRRLMLCGPTRNVGPHYSGTFANGFDFIQRIN